MHLDVCLMGANHLVTISQHKSRASVPGSVHKLLSACVQVLQALQVKYGDLYRQDNVVLSGTHTHCGLGGYFQYTLFMMTSKGYIKESIQPLVNGIVKVCV